MQEMTTGLNRRALFADETVDYRKPAEPDEYSTVVLRFRTAKSDVDRVCYINEEKNVQAEMRKVSSDELFDYYQHVIQVENGQVRYYFQIIKDNEICYYNRLGETSDIRSCFAFCITPGFHTPDWAKGAVMYQIFVDRFCNGDEKNDPQSREYVYIGRPIYHVKDWKSKPSTMDVGCFYGGDLQGVRDKLDYLQYLGVEVIYFNPIFVSPSNHKYDCQDYDHVDPHYGVIVEDGGELVPEVSSTNEQATRYQIRSTAKANLDASDAFFADFMQEVHKRGMRVIIDGVFNHCGSFNKWLDRERIYEATGNYKPGAYVSEESPYISFFKFNNKNGWPYNGSYDGWWGHDTLPKLNYEESKMLHGYILRIAAKWVLPPYSVDGWRLDVAADLGHSEDYNHEFWREFRNTVKKANPEAMILAEHYGDPSNWLQGDQWDTVMNYDAFMEPLTWFLTGMEKHSDEYNGRLFGDADSFFRSMKYHMSRLQTPSLQVAMNQLSNHDHSRFLTRTNQIVGRIGTAGPDMANNGVNYGIFREAVMIQMTWPGAPTLYYGDETGVCGWTDPDSRRTYPWGHENYELIEYHRYMISLHKRYPALRNGSLKELMTERQMIAYGRMSGNNKCVVVINNSASNREIKVPVWELGITDKQPLYRAMLSHSIGYNAGTWEYQVEDGILRLQMDGNTAYLFSNEKP